MMPPHRKISRKKTQAVASEHEIPNRNVAVGLFCVVDGGAVLFREQLYGCPPGSVAMFNVYYRLPRQPRDPTTLRQPEIDRKRLAKCSGRPISSHSRLRKWLHR